MSGASAGGATIELRRDKTVEEMSPRSKQLAQKAEEHLRDKLRNSFQQVLMNCEKLDVQQTGTLDREAFRTALSRSFACRLTDAEFEAFHLKCVSSLVWPMRTVPFAFSLYFFPCFFRGRAINVLFVCLLAASILPPASGVLRSLRGHALPVVVMH